MSMSYFIYPNKKTPCADEFGDGLSFFFEQVGGYGETAEVEQVSNILNIDLSAFQDVNYLSEDSAEVIKHWRDIDVFTATVDSFIQKLKAQPDFYKQVKHNPDTKLQHAELHRLALIRDTAEYNHRMAALQSQPFYYYPPDYGYLSEGRLFKDLETLRQTLACYKRHGVTKIRLEYM